MKKTLKDGISYIIFGYRQLTVPKRPKGGACRILMYHAIEESERSSDPMGLALPEKVFYMHMKYLKENGFYVMHLAELIKIIQEGSPIQEKATVITFDDGFQSVLTNAAPILAEFNFKATFFVNASFLDGRKEACFIKGDWKPLGWGGVNKLYRCGHSIGSHGLTHKRLTGVSTGELEDEIKKSKEAVENAIGARIYTFSFPHGAYNDTVKEALKNNNFYCACSSINGVNTKDTDIFAMRRTEITSFDDAPFKFEKKMLGCYDWLGMIDRYLDMR